MAPDRLQLVHGRDRLAAGGVAVIGRGEDHLPGQRHLGRIGGPERLGEPPADDPVHQGGGAVLARGCRSAPATRRALACWPTCSTGRDGRRGSGADEASAIPTMPPIETPQNDARSTPSRSSRATTSCDEVVHRVGAVRHRRSPVAPMVVPDDPEPFGQRRYVSVPQPHVGAERVGRAPAPVRRPGRRSRDGPRSARHRRSFRPRYHAYRLGAPMTVRRFAANKPLC